jgi:UDP-N-acetylglucosamine pyrophosphorylase
MKKQLKMKLESLSQEHLIRDIDSFSEQECTICLQQLSGKTLEFVLLQKTSWMNRTKRCLFFPLDKIPSAEDQEKREKIRTKGALMLAGGQGSRLGLSGPKGCFSFFGKSLFERHAHGLLHVPCSIMTSKLNHQDTISFFEERHFFGHSNTTFFSQDTLPLLDEDGRWFWAAPGKIAEGPDGNGSVFKAFALSGMLQQFERWGIECISIFPVDNPMAQPLDAFFASFHEQEDADLSFKCIEVTHSDEPMGRLVKTEEGLNIVEFAELSEQQRKDYLLANAGSYLVNLNLMRRLANREFPLHWAWKACDRWSKGHTEKKFCWKGERFVVDALVHAEKPRALLYPRKTCYAPLKEKSSIAEIEQLLMERERSSVV